MAQQVVGIGSAPNDGTGDPLRDAFDKLNDNDTELYASVGALTVSIAGVAKRATVRAATTANITIATALNNGDTLDGVTLATGDLVLVKNQSAPAENGIIVVGTSPARSTEFDTYDEHPGAVIAVQEGTANADTLWICTSNVGGTLNSTSIVFTSINIAATSFASQSEVRTGTDTTKALSPGNIYSGADTVTLTDASTIAVDMATFINAKVTLTDNRTLGQPSNPKNGQCGCIEIIQDGTGSRTLAYHADWLFAGGTDPTLSTAASAKDLLFYQVLSNGKTFGNLVKAVA